MKKILLFATVAAVGIVVAYYVLLDNQLSEKA